MRWLAIVSVSVFGPLGIFGCNVPLAHYKTMGCTPIGKLPSGCPERYECPSITAHDNAKCYFNGKTYNIGETLPEDAVSRFCSALCFCRPDESYATIFCAHVDCAEFFNSFDHENCVRTYEKHKCCSVGLVCGAERDKLAECEMDNETYKEGQRIYFKGNRCRSCICGAGFDANATDTDPNCYDSVCGFELFESEQLYGGGFPVYRKDRCCPWEWRLPQEADKVVQGATQTTANPNLQCKHGKLTLNVGDSLEIQQEASKGQKMTCSCEVPPLLHCILN